MRRASSRFFVATSPVGLLRAGVRAHFEPKTEVTGITVGANCGARTGAILPLNPSCRLRFAYKEDPVQKNMAFMVGFLNKKMAQIWDLPMSVFLRNYYFFACAFSLFRAPARDWRDKNWKSRAQAFESREGRGDRHNPHNFWRVGRGGR